MSHGTKNWIECKNGDKPVTYAHPCLEPYLKDTLGQIIYQEQVLLICREISGMSWEDITDLRQAMSKSYGEEFFKKYKDKFIPGAMKAGMDKEVANRVFDQMSAFGSWAMNLSHCVSYGYISYWCCWLKAHYPLEFAIATLNHESDPQQQIKLLREMEAMGYGYRPIDLKQGGKQWVIAKGGKEAIAPLTAIRGIGPKYASQIIAARRRQEPLPPGLEKRLSHATTDIDSLYPVQAALDSMYPDGLSAPQHSLPDHPDQGFGRVS